MCTIVCHCHLLAEFWTDPLYVRGIFPTRQVEMTPGLEKVIKKSILWNSFLRAAPPLTNHTRQIRFKPI